MPTTTDEAPRRQQDRDRQPGSSPLDEPRNFETPAPAPRMNSDTPPEDTDVFNQAEEINMNGSER